MRSVPLPFLSKITLLWTRAREPGPVSPVKVDSPLPFPWTQRGEIYTQRRRLILYTVRELTFEEIARKEKCSRHAVEKSVVAALKKIQKYFK